MTHYTCPVCTFPRMTEPVEEGTICPCCGTEFGYDDDLGVTYAQLRARWVARGRPWFSVATMLTPGWRDWLAGAALAVLGAELILIWGLL